MSSVYTSAAAKTKPLPEEKQQNLIEPLLCTAGKLYKVRQLSWVPYTFQLDKI